jgi:hypothetical protein
MKTKLITLVIALLGLSINAASAEAPSVSGDVGAKYASDYHRRGEALSAEALQAQVGFNIGLGSVDFYGDLFTNQSTDSTGTDTNEATFGLGTSLWGDSLNAYLGVYNTDSGSREDDLEAFASVSLNTLLAPRVSIFRDTDDSLYTFEGQISHEVNLNLLDLELAGILGNTDTSATSDSTYYGAKLTASKTVKESLNLYADVALSDNDTRNNETVWGVGLSVKF